MDNTFPKGTYVVLLQACDGTKDCWGTSIPADYCYQLREDSDTFNFRIVLDNKGPQENGWYLTSRNPSSGFMKLRAATEREIEEYKRLGKPYDVTTLPVERCVVNNYPLY